MSAEQIVLVREMEALQSLLDSSRRLAEQQSRELVHLTSQLRGCQRDAHVVRSRLVEAETEASRWRNLYEEATFSIAEDRKSFGKLLEGQRRTARVAKLPAKQPPTALAVDERRRSQELPALLPPGSYY